MSPPKPSPNARPCWCLMRAGQLWGLTLYLNFLKFKRYCGPRDSFQNHSLLNGVCDPLKNSLALRLIHIHTCLAGMEGQERVSVTAASLDPGCRSACAVLLAPSHLIPQNNRTYERLFGHLSIVLCHCYPWSWQFIFIQGERRRNKEKKKPKHNNKKNRRKDGGVDEKLTISKPVKPGRLRFYGIMVDGCTM